MKVWGLGLSLIFPIIDNFRTSVYAGVVGLFG